MLKCECEAMTRCHTLVNDHPLHALFEQVGGAQPFDSSTQHPLLLGQPALQPGYLILQQLILMLAKSRGREGEREGRVRYKQHWIPGA